MSIKKIEDIIRRFSSVEKDQDNEKFACPSCGSQVNMKELVEKDVSFGCINCVK